MNDTLILTGMQDGHVAAAHHLSQSIAWPHRVQDWHAILRHSRGVVAFEGERLVGTAICTLYPDRARLNMVIVHPDMRGRGLGRRIVEAALAQAGALHMSLIATDDGFPLYEKLGFVAYGEIAQYQGIVSAVPPPDGTVRAGGIADLDAVAAMDRAAGSPERRALLADMIGRGTLWLAPDGFAIASAFGRGTSLGPLVARDSKTARGLIAAATQGMEGAFLRMDTDPADGLAPDIAAMGLAHVGGGRVMHRGPLPQPRGLTNYSLASQALG